MLTYRVNCIGFNPFSWLVGTITDNITDEIFTAINQSLGEALGWLIDWFMQTAIAPLGPSLTKFIQYTNLGSISLKDFIDKFSIFSGMFLATLFFGFGLIVYFVSGKVTDSRDTPVSLFARYAIAIAICYKHNVIVNTVLKMIDEIYSTMTNESIQNLFTGNDQPILNIVKKGADGTISILGITGPGTLDVTFPGVGLVILLVQIALVWKLVKGFLKLYCEMISRYIVTIVLLLLFSAFGGTIVSNNTSSIFKSYLRTLFSSFLVMIFNMTWFKGCLIAVLGSTDDFTLIRYIFVLELLAFGLKFDGMLRSMGLGVATGGSRIGNAISGAGRNLANALRTANDARKSGGSLLKAGGLATNNPGMFKLGSLMSASLPEAISKKGQLGSLGHMAAEYGARGMKMPPNKLTEKDAAGIMNNALKNPGDKEAQNAVKGLSDQSILAGARYLAKQNNSGLDVQAAAVKQFKGADGQMHTGFAVSGQRTELDKDGKPVLDKNGNAKVHDFSGTMADAKAFDSAQAIDPEIGTALKCDNTLKNGETCNVSEAADKAGQGAADALANAKGLNLSEDAYLQRDGFDSNGQEAFNVMDGGKQVGTITGSDFTAAASMNAVGSDDIRRAEAQYEVGKAVEGTGGKAGEATATGYTASVQSNESMQAPLAATIDRSEDGTGVGTITNTATGESQSFSISSDMADMSNNDILSSASAVDAAKSVGGGDNASLSEYTPTAYSAQVDGSQEGLTASVVDGKAVVSNADGSDYREIPMSEGQSLGEALRSQEGQDAISALSDGKSASSFEPIEMTCSKLQDADGNMVEMSASLDRDSGKCSISLGENDTQTFDVPAGMSLSEAINSDQGRAAISELAGQDIGLTSNDFDVNENKCGITAASTVSVTEGDGDRAIVSRDGHEVGSYDLNGQTLEQSLSSETGRGAIDGALGSNESIGADRGDANASYSSDDFTPSEYSGTATTREATLNAVFDGNEGTVTNSVTGEESSIHVADGQTYEQALSSYAERLSSSDTPTSEDGQAERSVAPGGGTVSDWISTDYDIPVSGGEGPQGNYHVHVDDNGNGTYDAHITDSEGNAVGGENGTGNYHGEDDTVGNYLRDTIQTSGNYDSVSALEEDPNRPGVYHTTATKGDTETTVTVVDKGVYAESRYDNDPRSHMESAIDSNGNTLSFDINYGRG
ncbi:MAG: hypothetical protein J6M44_08045, partial [Butyrivibrio sp.]|nr:hypothetical protein [Butyrivibrio sp.]